MSRKIKAVFFDAGNTLLYLDYEFITTEVKNSGIDTDLETVRRAEYDSRRVIDKAMEKNVIEPEEIWPMYFTGILQGSGILDESVVLETMQRIKDRNDLFGLWTYVPDEVRETLSKLREDGFKIGIISNSDGSLKPLLEKTNMTDSVDFAIDSFVFGVEKPDTKIFNEALRLADEPPEACIHIGDIYAADVIGARDAGIHPVLLDPFGEKTSDCDVIDSIPKIIPLIKKLD